MSARSWLVSVIAEAHDIIHSRDVGDDAVLGGNIVKRVEFKDGADTRSGRNPEYVDLRLRSFDRREVDGDSVPAVDDVADALVGVSDPEGAALDGESVDGDAGHVPAPRPRLVFASDPRRYVAKSDVSDVIGQAARGLIQAGLTASSSRSASLPDSSRGLGLRFPSFDTDVDSLGYEKPARVSLNLELDPTAFLAIQCLLDAFEQGLDVRIVTEPTAVAAVDQILHDRRRDADPPPVAPGPGVVGSP